MTLQAISSPAQIDLSKHGVIEASAGTGKTYTIENLVTRFLVETELNLSQILLVTFTEKATSEMKERIRTQVERKLNDTLAENIREKLQATVDHFDEASIYTIHGFCNQVLRQYAFENNLVFDPELVDENQILEKLIYQIYRYEWHSQYGDKLTDVLEKAEFSKGGQYRFEKIVTGVASRYQPELQDQIVPVPKDPEDGSTLKSRTVLRLHEFARQYRLEQGMISYNDMLRLVWEAVSNNKPVSRVLLSGLRQRFKVALVDEFQDTDRLQWQIFQKVFLESDQGNRLFLVGDPKQSIYSFRGADVGTYLTAVKQLLNRQDAAGYRLETNWRSLPNLLAGFNTIFKENWFPQDSGLSYTDVNAPTTANRKVLLVRDDSHRAPITLVDLKEKSGNPAQRDYFPFLAREIKRLVSTPLIEYVRGNRRITLGYSSIVILVQKKSEFYPLERLLRKHGIPYSIYKQTGLYDTREALNLLYLLEAIADPTRASLTRKALLTDFFKIPSTLLFNEADGGISLAIQQQMDRWRELASERRWAQLFQSILKDTPVLYRRVGEDYEPIEDRSAVNYHHLVEVLMTEVMRSQPDLMELLRWFRQQCSEDSDVAEDENLLRLETEKPCVKLMTIHTAKGLEFPIVFVAGGFTRGMNPTYYRYHNEDGNIVYDLTKTDSVSNEIKKRHQEEINQEYRRLYYVAFTRAMLKLYLPFNLKKQDEPPMGSFIREVLSNTQESLKSKSLAAIIQPNDDGNTPEALNIQPVLDQLPKQLVGDDDDEAFKIPEPLLPRVESFAHRRLRLHSYSSLEVHRYPHREESSTPLFGEEETVDTGEGVEKISVVVEDEETAPLEQVVTLPPGSQTGSALHEIFEQIDFSLADESSTLETFQQNEGVRRLIEERLLKNRLVKPEQTDLLASYIQAAAGMVYHTLRTPLTMDGRSFRLCGIPTSHQRHELEFVMPLPVASKDGSLAEGVVIQEGYLKGFIDLVFQVNGKYFILDWKSNILPDYTSESIQRSMNEMNYHLQYKIYTLALEKWLMQHGLEFMKVFGGVYYLYLRGMNETDPSRGVFQFVPDPGFDVQNFRADIIKKLQANK